MHHPGPPRFVAVGDDVELAPRDPDPASTYEWRVARAPPSSRATVGDAPVEHFVPDVPGQYRVELSAPDGTHGLTIRAFPGDLGVDPAGGAYGRSGVGTGADAPERAAAEAEETYGGDGAGDTGPGGRPRVELSARTTDEDVVVRARPRPHPDGPERAGDLHVEFLLDDRDALERSDVTVGGRELSIPLGRLPGCARVHAVAVGSDGYSVPDAVELERDGSRTGAAGVEVTRPYDPPEWAGDGTIYEIYVRTFPGRGDARTGGVEDGSGESVFDAIVERLDYLEGLGVDALWLTPVLENDHAPHGYNVTDFFSIAADLGTRADYERFVEAAHERDLRVLFDLVANHSAREHPYFRAAVADPDSEYREWYEWRGPGEPETYFDWQHIANFDFDHLPVRRHLLDAVDTWAPLVDGFRCDMAWAVPESFWREVHDRCKARDREFLLLDETIPYVPDFQAGLFDVHFDSTTYAALRRVGAGEGAEAVLDAVEERARIGFPDRAGFMLYAENHDETRYLLECGRPAAEAALGALFTLPGVPMVYAGQEFGQRGKRDPLAWEHADDALREHVRRLATARDREEALSGAADLRRIDYEVREGPTDRVVAFARTLGGGEDGVGARERAGDAGGHGAAGAGGHEDDEAVVAVLNFGAESATVAVGPDAGEVDLVTAEPVATDDGIAVESVVAVPADPSTVGGR